MRVVYLDVLLILNFCMDFCILRAAAALDGRQCSTMRLCVAALAGAVYAVLCVVWPAFAVVPLRLVSCAGMACLAYRVYQPKQLVRQTLLVLLVSAVFGGCVLALEQLSGAELTAGGVLYAPVTRKVLVIAAALAYGLSGMVFRGHARENRPRGETVRIRCGANIQEFFLMVDSGNTLRDPATGRPVLVLTRAAAIRILPEEARFVPLLLQEDNAAELVQRAQQAGARGLRLVAFHSIGGDGMMPCFHPDAIIRENGREYDSMAAISGTIEAGAFEGLIEP